MRTPRLKLLILSLSLLITIGALGVSTPASAGELWLEPALMSELNTVLKVGDGLHKSLVQQDEEQIELSLRDILVELERARSASVLAKPHDRRHLIRILDAAYEQFELTQSAFGEERRARMEDGFNQLVNLVRVYHVDRAYSIFFCPKDRATWVQKGGRAENPFRNDNHREQCGMRVPR